MKTKSLIIVAASLALLAANSALADGRDGRGRGHDDNRSYERHHSDSRYEHRSRDRGRDYYRYDNRYDNRSRHGSYNYHHQYRAPRPQYNYYSYNYVTPRPYYQSYAYVPYNGRWRRGQYLGHYHSYYQPVYYSHYRLRPPPHGYHWVRDDRGDFILAAIATGLILEVILGGY